MGFKYIRKKYIFMYISSYMCVGAAFKTRPIAIRTCNDDFECVQARRTRTLENKLPKIIFFKYYDKKRIFWAYYWYILMMINIFNNFLKMSSRQVQTRIFEVKIRLCKQMKQVWPRPKFVMFAGIAEMFESNRNEFHALLVGVVVWQQAM